MKISKFFSKVLMKIKYIIKQLLPPFVLDLVRKLSNPNNGGFKRSFKSWNDALSNGTTYNTNEVFWKTLNAARLVRDGKAAYERDSVIFDKVQYDLNLLSSLLLIANIQNKLNVVDFGGALGTSFRQNKKFLDILQIQKKWAVVEQSEFVRIGKSEFQTDTLVFLESLSEVNFDVDVVLLGGSLCYIEHAYRVLDEIKNLSPKSILIVRTPFSDLSDDEISLQVVPKSIYDASYPIWTFSESKLLDYLSDNYFLFEQWEDALQADKDAIAKGFLFIKKSD
jgi:putative methyltransferase (TIGR04325 family)